MKFIQPRKRAKAGSIVMDRSSFTERLAAFRKSVLDCMKKGEDTAPKQISEALKTDSWKVKSALDRLVNEKLIERSGKGKYTRYRRR